MPVEPCEDTPVPDTLITTEELRAKAMAMPPQWQKLEGKAAEEMGEVLVGKSSVGPIQRRLSNGLRVNLMSMDAEPQRAAVRLYVPGKSLH
jgi:hypothetical protein